MKKIIFLQINSRSFGGVWGVNKALGEEFIKRGYDVSMVAIRQNHPGILEDTLEEYKIHTINEIDEWKILHKRDVLNSLKKGPINFLKTLKKYFIDNKKLNNDYKKLKEYLYRENPNYIIASHYQALLGIPKKYLKRTIHVQHSSFKLLNQDRYNYKILKKYNKDLFCLMWLSESIDKLAKKKGFIKNRYIYNPLKFSNEIRADVVNNKKIIVITRIFKEKRIDLMIKIVNDVFSENKFEDWNFEIYGNGVDSLSKASKDILNRNKQIKYMGITNDPKKILLQSSVNLNTSLYEGFSLSIMEAFCCGVPTISFNFGESVYDEIKNDYNGYVIENDNITEFKDKLKFILSNPKKLEELSKNSFEFAKKFDINYIADEWEHLFNEIDEEGD